MKFALVGYGKMGMAIEEIALQKGHEIVLKINIDNLEDFTTANLKKADVAIEFSHPDSAFENIKTCLKAGIPVICGTTGWLQRYEEAINICKQQQGALLVASNFSIGVNIFFEVNKRLAALMVPHTNY